MTMGHRTRQAGASLRTIQRHNQTPQFGGIETRLNLDPKPLREHNPKLSALTQTRSAPLPGHCGILNDFDGNNLLFGFRLCYPLAPGIQRKHVHSMSLAKLFAPKTALLEL